MESTSLVLASAAVAAVLLVSQSVLAGRKRLMRPAVEHQAGNSQEKGFRER
jgi:hypothetical protein